MAKRREYWGAEVETAPRDELRRIQQERLKELVERLYQRSAYYKRRFAEVGIKPDDIRTVEDIRKIPLTRYTHDIPPEDLLTIPLSEAPFIMSSGGTTGTPKPLYLSRKDLDMWGEIVGGRLSTMYGIGRGDVMHMGFPWVVPMEGFLKAGARYLPMYHTTMFVDSQIRLMESMKVSSIFCGAAQFLGIYRRAKEMGVNLGKAGLRVAIFTGESWAENYRKRMEAELGMKFYDYYGMMEIGPTAAECSEQDGLHVWDDINVVEIIDPDTEEPLPPGEPGEIIITPLWRETMPFLRYRSGDMAMWLEDEKCPCGRAFPRMSRLKGRIDHIIKVKESRVFPRDVEEVVHATPGLGTEFQVIVDKPGVLDVLKVRIETAQGVAPSPELKKTVEMELEKATKAVSEVELVPYGEIARGAGFKAQRIVRF